VVDKNSIYREERARLEREDWRLETGDWRLETGDWRLETGDWRQNKTASRRKTDAEGITRL